LYPLFRGQIALPDPEPDPASNHNVAEHQIIQRLLNIDHGLKLRVAAGDDCAVLQSGLTLTTDTMVEGVHFDARLSPEDVGYKCVAVSVSDIISMGARPVWALLSLSIPPESSTVWVDSFTTGLHSALNTFRVALIGGDTTRSTGATVVSTTLGGEAPQHPLTRNGAVPHDILWVTGWPGLAGAGYVIDSPPDTALNALRRPTPPVEFAIELVSKQLASAGLDISDGITSDLQRLANASDVGAKVFPEKLPAHKDIKHLNNLRSLQLDAGDDFQLLFTAPPSATDEILTIAASHQTKVTEIGIITNQKDLVLSGEPWPNTPFQHFPAPST
jgi:thiamine-monophosphate kinase